MMAKVDDGSRRQRKRSPETRPRSTRTDFLARALAALPWIGFGIFIIVVGGAVFAVAVAFFGVYALHELYTLLRPARPLVLAGFLGLIGLVAAAALGDQYQMVLALALALVVTFILSLVRSDRSHSTISMAVTMLGVIWIGLALAHAVLLRELPHGGALLFDVLAATFIGDTAAYLGGKRYGRAPLAPRISPYKTVEGLVFGILGAIVGFWFAGLYQDWLADWQALAIGAVIGCVAPLGDLFESLLKRDLAVKDSGRFFGVHGGVMDRLDAAFFTVVAGYYVSRAIVG